MTPQIGPRAATKLLERFGSAENVFHATRGELESLRLKPESVESILKREFHEKADRHHLFESVNFGNSVADFDNRSDFGNRHTCVEVFDLLPDYIVDFVSFNCFHIFI